MKLTNNARAGALALISAVAFAVVPTALAATVPSQLRVLTASGRTLADHVQYTGPTTVEASKKADCFGSPSSAKEHELSDANALGLLSDATRLRAALDPLLVTDSFFEDFGSLGVCGIGGKEAPFVPFDSEDPQPTPYWYLAQNGVAAAAGPNQLSLEPGDDVLYYLTKGTEPAPPDQLEIDVPAAVDPGKPIKVTVYAYDSGTGKRKPAEGAEIGGETTDKAGRATIEAAASGPAARRLPLQATRGDDVPSSRQTVCLATDCEPKGELILGSPSRDEIAGTENADRVKPGGGKDLVGAGDGDDSVNAKGGGRDIVDCGAGDADRAVVSGRDKARNCEKVVRD